MTAMLYLVWIDSPVPVDAELDDDCQRLRPGLWLVRTEQTRSQLYHRLKRALPDAPALLVAPLADRRDGWPKFKGMDSGALAWLREGE